MRGKTKKGVPGKPLTRSSVVDSKKATEEKKMKVSMFQPTSSKQQEEEKARYLESLDEVSKGPHDAFSPVSANSSSKGTGSFSKVTRSVSKEVSVLPSEPFTSPTGSSSGSSADVSPLGIPLDVSPSPDSGNLHSPVPTSSSLDSQMVAESTGAHKGDKKDFFEAESGKRKEEIAVQVSSEGGEESETRHTAGPQGEELKDKSLSCAEVCLVKVNEVCSVGPLIAREDPKNPKHLLFESASEISKKEEFPPLAATVGVPSPPKLNPPQATGLFANNRKFSHGLKLNEFKVEETVEIENEDLDRASPFEFSLVGYFIGRFPGRWALKQLTNSWTVKSQVSHHDSGWIIFSFTSEEDLLRVLEGGPYFVFGRSLLLKRMAASFHFDTKDLTIFPVWVQLPNLPLMMWVERAMGKVCSALGKPLYADKLTALKARINFARVLVEIDVSKDLKELIPIKLANGDTYVQRVVYENLPKYCSECSRIGHLKGDCERRKAVAMKEDTNQKKVIELKAPEMEKGKGFRYPQKGGKAKPTAPLYVTKAAYEKLKDDIFEEILAEDESPEKEEEEVAKGSDGAIKNSVVVATSNSFNALATSDDEGEEEDSVKDPEEDLEETSMVGETPQGSVIPKPDSGAGVEPIEKPFTQVSSRKKGKRVAEGGSQDRRGDASGCHSHSQ